MTSEIVISAAGTTFSGSDAVLLFKAITLRSGLKLAQAGIKLNRWTTTSDLFKMATTYTGKPYKRGQYEQARADLTVWIDTMKAAMPVTVEEGHQHYPVYLDGQKVMD